MSHTRKEVINPLNQYTMEKNRYMLIHMDRKIRRFESIEAAKGYALCHCRGNYEFYIIVDTLENEVVYRWSY